MPTSRSVAGASGYAGALAAALLDRHPRFELVAVTSRSDVGTPPERPLPAPPRAADARGVRRRAPRAGRRGDRRLPARRRGAGGRRAARARGARGRPVAPTSACACVDIYEQWYVPHPHPELIGEAVYGLPELRRDADRGRRPRGQPRLLPDRGAAGAGAARAPGSTTSSSTPRPACRAPGATPTATTHFVSADENVTPYGVAGHRHVTEIDQELAFLGAADPGDLHAAPRAARPGRAGLVLLHAARAGRRRRRSSRARTRTSRSSR